MTPLVPSHYYRHSDSWPGWAVGAHCTTKQDKHTVASTAGAMGSPWATTNMINGTQHTISRRVTQGSRGQVTTLGPSVYVWHAHHPHITKVGEADDSGTALVAADRTERATGVLWCPDDDVVMAIEKGKDITTGPAGWWTDVLHRDSFACCRDAICRVGPQRFRWVDAVYIVC